MTPSLRFYYAHSKEAEAGRTRGQITCAGINPAGDVSDA
ncbi:MAG: hypothetical protein QOG21_1602 [Actinomycetota bacterium]|jgi:hypothetical protein|nr:hypothetical protein [Actinomycetota bacterium]